MDKGNNEITVNRTFKSRIFAMLYRDKEGILSEFLSQNRMEAKSMSIYEYDAEKHIRQEREDAWADGIETGISETSILIAKLAENGDLAQLEELGKAPDGLKALLKKYNISR